MPIQNLIVLSVPGLRSGDVTPERTPTLFEWANRGTLTELVPTFPCLTSPVQATMWTGLPPGEHGVIANGFFHEERNVVEFWVARNGVVAGEQIWDALRKARPGSTSAVWHAQNIKDAGADFIVTPAPIHEPDGTTKLWCYSKPDWLYQELLERLGHFPLQHYWGPLANIESTRWILRAAADLIERHTPTLQWVYVPHLDYAAQKFGPNSDEALTSLAELDAELAAFARSIAAHPAGSKAVFLVAGEYALTEVSEVVYPNRLLREAGLLRVRVEDGREHIDLERSDAFAVVDHQLANVYTRGNAGAARRAGEVLAAAGGVAHAHVGSDRARMGMDHARSGDVVVVADPHAWFAYYWWMDAALAPTFACTVDIHSKPGYDPVELFFDPTTRTIPLQPDLVKGSHGAPAAEPRQRTVLICSGVAAEVDAGNVYRDVDLKRIILSLLGS